MMTRAAWIFLASLGVSFVACVRTTDSHDGGVPDASATRPTVDARASSNDATDARAVDAGGDDLAPLTP